MQVNAQVGINLAFPAQNTTTNFTPVRAGKQGTLIAVILDESGSMSVCRDATISGFNEFVQGQAQAQNAGQAYLSLIKFDAPNVKTVYENVPVSQVEPLTHKTYEPGGGTNLLDAVGETITRINTLLSQIHHTDRPGVLVMIMTDGEENASRTYSHAQIKSMVKICETEADFTFMFLGANVDAFAMGSTFGMNASNTAAYSTSSMAATMSVMSESATRVRAAKSAGMSTQELYASASLYSDEDRALMQRGTK
jgi:hypothetical protein